MDQPATRESHERERDLDRLLTFVDAVVAIAITLLVLPLVELTSDVTGGDSVADLLHAHLSQLWSFLLSFVVIARLWFAQHRAMRHVMAANARLGHLLAVWMLTIVFLPFPTALVASAGEQPATKILYVGTIALSTLTLAVIDALVLRHPELTDGIAPTGLRSAVTSAVLLLIALAIMLAVPATSYYPMLLLLLDPLVERALQAFSTAR
ncbi:TMEM175 family protein [Angustibacter sp. McL0619]|uniref:TMEM175 family protein n=1 Tax=Angustibacter sp. McL0619 TaxID=3415676 RepID=UPI003CE71B30